MSLDGPLFSERHGRKRTLSDEDFAKLVWHTVNRFRRALYLGQKLSKPNPWDEPILTAQDFLRRLGVDDVHRHVMPGMRPTGPPVSWIFHPDVLFDSLEYLYSDVVAKPLFDPEDEDPDDRQRSYDRAQGQHDFRLALNNELEHHDPPMEMLENGHIVERIPDAFHGLVDEEVPKDVPKPIREPIEAAIEQFRSRGATLTDKKGAVLRLAEAIEPLRKDLDDTILSEDTSALFHIANGFAIRHNKREQKRDYDQDAWYEWMFYVYLATARAIIKELDRQELRDRWVDKAVRESAGGLDF
jgi:hypothetical protein